MRYLYKISKLMFVMGFLVWFGVVGHSDYMSMIDEYYSCGDLIKTLLIGFTLMIPFISFKVFGGKNGK